MIRRIAAAFMLLTAPVTAAPSLVQAIELVESGGNEMAVGRNGEVGCLQIRQCVIDDVNRRYADRDSARMRWTLQDAFRRSASRAIFEQYLSIYATPQRLGRAVTDEDRARIWNGGPSGYLKPSTLRYWSKVKKHLNL